MVFTSVVAAECTPDMLGMFIIIFANIRHVKIAIKSFYGRELGFLEFIPAGDVLIWINAFSGK